MQRQECRQAPRPRLPPVQSVAQDKVAADISHPSFKHIWNPPRTPQLVAGDTISGYGQDRDVPRPHARETERYSKKPSHFAVAFDEQPSFHNMSAGNGACAIYLAFVTALSARV